jgi:4-amino-4-deoxy-L-arabinose transferase-like glycosyltransferase
LPTKMPFLRLEFAKAYILSVLQLFRKDMRFFLAAFLLALALRLVFVLHFPAVVDDSRLYADIAMNWLQHGVYGITNSGQVMPTLSRLPGYPAFLAAIFALFGWSNFRAVLLIQVAFDLGTCLIVADIARRIFSDRAAKAAFMLAGLCPFLANYSAAALTETLEIFFTALALNFAVCGVIELQNESRNETRPPSTAIWIATGLSVGASLLLRPDGGILLAAILIYLGFLFPKIIFGKKEKEKKRPTSVSPIVRTAIAVTLSALALLIPWTWRNLRNLHRFEPLAPRYANDADEPVTTGFNRWTKTWMADYVSVEEIYWNVPGDAIDVNRLPNRAFDSPAQREETAQLFDEYNRDHDLTPELDARFAALAATRIRSHPLRYYLWLPALRISDMWLRPRTELFPSDPRWWEFNDERLWLSVSIVFGLINLGYVLVAAAGLVRTHSVPALGLLISFVLLRSLFLGTLENPEPRYTLECYPVVILLAAALFIGKSDATHQKPA